MRTLDPIKLRWKRLADGRESAFLDITIPGTPRRKEYLRIHRGGDISRRESKDAERLALAIWQRRLNEYNLARAGMRSSMSSHRLLVPFYEECCASRSVTESTRASWRTSLGHLKRYLAARHISEGNVTLSDIDAQFCKDYLAYLQGEALTTAINRGRDIRCHGGRTRSRTAPKPLAPSTARLIFHKFKTCLRRAYDAGLIPSNPSSSVRRIRAGMPRREYLSPEEVRRLASTPYTHDVVCRAFLFSCLTGLRYSDISMLTWDMVVEVGGRMRLHYRQTKTQGQMYLDISDLALSYMGERSDGLVFSGLPLSPSCNAALKRWLLSAGIDRRITFHSARHTAAVLLLTAGAEIYTVSRILGHTSLASTQIYADIVDAKRTEAIDALADLLGDTSGTR